MSHDDTHNSRDDQERSGGASPTHHASSGDNRLAPVITLHHHTDTHDTHDTDHDNTPVVIEGEIVTCGQQAGNATPGNGRGGVAARPLPPRPRDGTTACRHSGNPSRHRHQRESPGPQHVYSCFSGAGSSFSGGATPTAPPATNARCAPPEIAGDQGPPPGMGGPRHRRKSPPSWPGHGLDQRAPAWARAAGGRRADRARNAPRSRRRPRHRAPKGRFPGHRPCCWGHRDAIAWTVTFVTVYGHRPHQRGAGGAVLGLWALGRARTDAPTWAAPVDDDEDGTGRGVIVDESAVVKRAAQPRPERTQQQVQARLEHSAGTSHPSHDDGRGWHCQSCCLRASPWRCSTTTKTSSPTHLLRLPVEVWPTEPKDKPGVLDLWVADQGSLTKTGRAVAAAARRDHRLLTGVPVGVTPRSDLVTGRLFGTNWGIAGMMGSGKSTSSSSTSSPEPSSTHWSRSTSTAWPTTPTTTRSNRSHGPCSVLRRPGQGADRPRRPQAADVGAVATRTETVPQLGNRS